MFAGPNGSGKSTLNTVLPRRLLGTYLNPDELELKTNLMPAWFKHAVWDKILR
jgi:predicted ABC-type ATPase